ncbi:MAG: hypothetical protein ACREOW_13355 [Thermodesulfobacteriota bacterium]
MQVKTLSQQSMGGVAFTPPRGEFLSAGCPAIRGVSPEYPNTDNPRGIIGMMRYMRMLPVFLAAVVVLVLGTATPESWAAPFSAAKIIFEVNATDRDAGIQVFLDGEPWKNVKIFNPNKLQIAEYQGKGSVEGFGFTELFSESNEPPFEDFPLQDVLDLFPQGKYEFKGTTVGGASLKSMATLSHVIPCGPEIVSEDTLPFDEAIIKWTPVTNELDPATEECGESTDLDIVGYQVIVGTFQVTLPASATQVTVPPEFLEPNTVYLFEVLAIEKSGNQTITEGSFETE